MKSYFLTDLQKPELLRDALSGTLPGQEAPWLLTSAAGDPVVYFYIECEKDLFEVQADISGRHHDKEEFVVSTLEKIGTIVGGRILSD